PAVFGRHDGVNGSLALTAAGPQPGVICKPQTVPPGAKQVPFVISADDDAAPWTGEIKVLGKATIDGKDVVREARAATISWPVPQANLPTITRMDRAGALAVRGKAPVRPTGEGGGRNVLQGGQVEGTRGTTRRWA